MSPTPKILESETMKPRKKQVKKAEALPKEFIKSVAELFNKQFKKERSDATFAVQGALYPDEALLCLGLAEVGRLRAISLYIYINLGKTIGVNPEQVTQILKSAMDLAASWFSQCFAESEEKGLEAVLAAMDEMDPNWQKVTWEKRTVYVRLSGDNQTLESAADRFLRENDPEKH